MDKNNIYAFISYNHKDVKWAKWLRRKLEWYRLPSEIHNEFDDSRYIRPVFRDRDELDSGILDKELKSRLESSKFLIVICSPNSASSDWVSDEVQYFIDLGRLEYIIPFIITGCPQYYNNGGDLNKALQGECFPYSLRYWNHNNPQKGLLGISVYDDGEKNKRKAFIRIVSRMLDINFDILWKRHLREMLFMTCSATLFAFLTLLAAYWFMIPINLNITLNGEESSLPKMENGILYVNECEYSTNKLDTVISVSNLPGYFRLRTIPVKFRANRFYNDIDTIIPLKIGIKQEHKLDIYRDNTFAIFSGHVYDGGIDNTKTLVPLSGVKVCIDDKCIITDSLGSFCFSFPISEQTLSKKIVLSKDNYFTIERIDECPSDNLKYILHRKCE